MRLARAAIGVTGLLACACKSVSGPRVGVASVSFEGNQALASPDLRERIATSPAPRFLGLFRVRWLGHQPFEPAVLQKDLERIERYCRRRGYYDAVVRAGRVIPAGEHWVDVEILIDEGKPVRVHSVQVEGLPATTSASLLARAQGGVRLVPGDRLDEDRFEESSHAMTQLLTERGYAYATVTPRAVVDLGRNEADLTYTVRLGPSAFVGAIEFDGLGGLPEAQIRRVFAVRPGDKYATDELEAGRRAVLDLGVFASVDVLPDLSDPTRTAVPIRVVATRSALRGLRAGFGLQLDFARADVHARFGWEHRNLFGGLRHLIVEERPSLVLFPTALPNFRLPERILPANSLSFTFRQPSFPEARTFTVVRAELNQYPVILPPIDPNQPVMPGYHEVRGVLGPERSFGSIFVRTALTYSIQANFPFTYFGEPNPAFRSVIASYLDLHAEFDLRDDPIMAHRGVFASASLQYAGGPLRGDAADMRFRPEMRMYLPLGDGVTLAGRGVLGLLFPRNYGENLGSDFLALPEVNPEGTRAGVPGYIRDLQITYFRGFFSGGPDSNRGYGFREIGPHGVNPAIIPGTIAEEKARCTPASADYARNLCFVPSGGLSLWEASVELRTPIHGGLGAVLFVDASDVAPKPLQVRLDVPHLAVGFGIRYATPVGPLRADLGFRIPGVQRIGRPLVPETDGVEPGRLLGILPAALAIGLGETY